MRNRYAIAATVFVILALFAAVIAFYARNFYPIYGLQLSSDTAVWGQFGDYLGGSLNPILSFVSVVLLIRSVGLQNEANTDLRDEIRNTERTERFRSLNSLFFGMMESQKSLLNEFKIETNQNGTAMVLQRVAAIHYLEENVGFLKDNGARDIDISMYLEWKDSNDQIYGIIRAFYVTVKIIFEKLTEENGFEVSDRKEQLLTLINFTDFAQLRLILLCMQFLDYPSTQYLNKNNEFIAALKEVGLSTDLY